MSELDEVVLVEIVDGNNMELEGAYKSGEFHDNSALIDDCKEKTRELARELQKTFKDKVEVKYVDIEEAGIENYLVIEEVRYLGFRYPITLINGQPVVAGGVMINEVITSINYLLNIPGEY